MNKALSAYFILLSFFNVATAATADFRVGNVDYSKLKVNNGEDYDRRIYEPVQDLNLVTSSVVNYNQVAAYNYNNLLEQPFRLSSKPVLTGKAAPYLVRIESTYFDESTGKAERMQGIGSVVMIPIETKPGEFTDFPALVTVSHLTHGQKLQIKTQEGKPLVIHPGARLANVDDDVEIIFLKHSIETPMTYDSRLKMIHGPMWMGLDTGVISEEQKFVDYDRIYVAKKQHVPILKNLLPKNSSGHNDVSTIEDMIRIFTQIAHKGLEKENLMRAIWDDYGVLQKPFLGDGYIAKARMLPGLSGAPLIRDIPNSIIASLYIYTYSIDGLVQGHHRFKKESYFVSSKSIVSLIEDYKKGKRGFTSNTRWRLKNGVTFRDYGYGVLETNIGKLPSGSFFKGDSGNAISVDGKVGIGNLGMQNARNSTIIGRVIENNGHRIPVLATPEVEKKWGKTTNEISQVIKPQHDLNALARLKMGLRNSAFTPIADYGCFYDFSEITGLNVRIQKNTDEIFSFKRTTEQLKKGFLENEMIVRGNNLKLEISGLFLTDLTSVANSENLAEVSGPSLTLIPQNGDSVQLSCYTNEADKNSSTSESASQVKIFRF